MDNKVGGTKFDNDKPACDLLPVDSILEIVKVLNFGSKKYGAWNWAKGISYRRLLSATLRHIFSYLRGEDKDLESGLSHIAHAACNCLFLLHFEKYKKELDDRIKEYYENSNMPSK